MLLVPHLSLWEEARLLGAVRTLPGWDRCTQPDFWVARSQRHTADTLGSFRLPAPPPIFPGVALGLPVRTFIAWGRG